MGLELQSLLFIFTCFKQHFYRKNVDFSRIQTRTIGVEVNQVDQLTHPYGTDSLSLQTLLPIKTH